ncbi:UDP-N-acetyl glucosamine 2-epimerase [Tersicoccus solisilvae]|uniref:UDP-N-acetyl glucosamine 2-epimerase n=1 Tax=Tersicoccus solisilvae TaxID=1882339 RepID=A0ABQ1NZF4_9MICC|nr:UDP-N-acetylglucosamine 2-epimerase [Tersicoccus solisilvae]GGC87282.1 UDP-N-acetyl glucosamine 2-epimerase [Tersicoccus solisilvae]
MRVLAFVGTRADLYPLAPVLTELASHVELHAATAVGFAPGAAAPLLAGAGLADGSFVHHDLGLHLAAPEPAGQTATGAALATAVGALIESTRPDVLLVLGDRWELLFVVPVAALHGVRIVHLHGGEVTEGALDERVRHAVTKLADQHGVATEGAARRVRQLGEDPRRVHRTGAPGLDRFADAAPLTDEQFAAEFGVTPRSPLLMVAYHPETATDGEDPGTVARRVYAAATATGGTVLVTHPGFDPGRERIVAVLDELAAAGDPHVILRENLGPLYPATMARADAMLGNSSSGIIEAASFGLPVVNVGERQRGREHGANVIDCADDAASLRRAIDAALDPAFAAASAATTNPYGDSHAAGRIAAVVRAAPEQSLVKTFIDLDGQDRAS